MKKKSKSVNIALYSSAFISVYPPASAVKKKTLKRSYPVKNRPFDSIWACGKIKLEFSQLKEILR
jgi:hypothetical protein